MASLFSAILPIVRNRLIEPVPKFWTDPELYEMMYSGVRDLWRDVVDLKQEHYLTIDDTNVSMPANTGALAGVPADVHKIYLIEPRDLTENGPHKGLTFLPLDYNDDFFRGARSRSSIEPSNGVIYYAIHKQGAPVGPPEVLVAPKVSSPVLLSFSYVPSLGVLTPASPVPIPGEADNAIIAWTIAFAHAKEDRIPDMNWLTIYATEKQHLLQSLGLRQYQEPQFVHAMFEDLW